MNAVTSESFASCPTVYMSVISNSLLFEIHDVCFVGMKVLSPHATSAHARTMGSLRPFMWVICSPLKLMTLPLSLFDALSGSQLLYPSAATVVPILIDCNIVYLCSGFMVDGSQH